MRERAFSKFSAETQALNKVVGITDMLAFNLINAEIQEITPTTVKKLVAGDGKASKEEVAAALDAYFDHNIFQTDDESDACAVGIAWLIQNGYIDPVYAPKNEENAAEAASERK